MSEENITNDILNAYSSIAGNQDATNSIIALIAISALTIVVKVAYKGILDHLFSKKPLLNKERTDVIPLTEHEVEINKESLEERISLRVKGTFEPILKEIKSELKELRKANSDNHECIVKLEKGIDGYHDTVKNLNEKLDTTVKEFAEHLGYSKAESKQFEEYKNKVNGLSKK